jgi:hypothetical protein
VVTPVLIVSYVLGLTHGPQGVAVGFSIVMVLSIVPVLLWAKHGTPITLKDILRAVAPSSTSVIIGAVEATILFGTYAFALLFVMNQKPMYAALLRETGLWPAGGPRTGAGGG